MTGEYPAQMASDAEIFSILWRHHGYIEVVRANMFPTEECDTDISYQMVLNEGVTKPD